MPAMIENDDLITESAHERLIAGKGGMAYYLCPAPACEMLVHREDTGNHALTCLPLRKEVAS